MKPEEYYETWQRLIAEQSELIDRRTSLENDLNETNTAIAHLEEVIDHLAPLAGIPVGADLAGIGITEAIRRVIEHSKSRMSAAEIRRALGDNGFDLSSLTAPMASIYKIVSRLIEAGEVEREKEDSNVYYRWKTAQADDLVQPTEITDDDIPF
jgi:hypothetical protein